MTKILWIALSLLLVACNENEAPKKKEVLQQRELNKAKDIDFDEDGFIKEKGKSALISGIPIIHFKSYGNLNIKGVHKSGHLSELTYTKDFKFYMDEELSYAATFSLLKIENKNIPSNVLNNMNSTFLYSPYTIEINSYDDLQTIQNISQAKHRELRLDVVAELANAKDINEITNLEVELLIEKKVIASTKIDKIRVKNDKLELNLTFENISSLELIDRRNFKINIKNFSYKRNNVHYHQLTQLQKLAKKASKIVIFNGNNKNIYYVLSHGKVSDYIPKRNFHSLLHTPLNISQLTMDEFLKKVRVSNFSKEDNLSPGSVYFLGVDNIFNLRRKSETTGQYEEFSNLKRKTITSILPGDEVELNLNLKRVVPKISHIKKIVLDSTVDVKETHCEREFGCKEVIVTHRGKCGVNIKDFLGFYDEQVYGKELVDKVAITGYAGKLKIDYNYMGGNLKSYFLVTPNNLSHLKKLVISLDSLDVTENVTYGFVEFNDCEHRKKGDNFKLIGFDPTPKEIRNIIDYKLSGEILIKRK